MRAAFRRLPGIVHGGGRPRRTAAPSGAGRPAAGARTGPAIAKFRIERFRIKPFAAGYQAGFEAVAALAISILVGLWADIRFDTGVVFLVVGSVVGFGSCVLRMVRYQRQVEREAAMAAARLHAMQTTDTPVGASTRPGDRDQAS